MSRKTTHQVSTIEELRAQIELEMKAKGLSARDLAEMGKIAPKTLSDLFKQGKKKETVRSDVILRIGKVLHTDPERCKRWLELAGHPEFSTHRISMFMNEAQANGDTQESSPVAAEKYFFDLIDEMKAGSQVLMCVCLTSKPAPIDDPELRKTVIDAIKGGLHMALACAYPSPNQYYSSKPNLASFYDQIRVWTRKLAGNLRASLEPSERYRVQAFFPWESSGERPPLVHPVMQHGEHRPCLVKLVKDGQEKYRLGGYGRRERRWLIVHPRPNAAPDEQQDAMEICTWWQDYFYDLLNGWHPSDPAQPFAESLTEWKQWKPELPGIP